jgi:aspartate/tyrosine/aromatic aminotransferase
MSTRMNNMRKLLYQKLNILSTPGNWEHVLKSVGLFSFTGLNGNFGLRVYKKVIPAEALFSVTVTMTII